MKKKIIAVFKTHFDYGYTDLAKNVLSQYCGSILDKAIVTCKETGVLGEHLKFKWTLPSYLMVKMYEQADIQKKKAIKELAKNGQMVSHALPFTMHTPLLDKKMLDNMFIFTNEYTKIFNLPFPISAKMTDVPGHTSSIIEPLVKNGVKFLHLGKNPACIAPKVPLLFWWEDLKGNRILTMYNQFYGSTIKPPKNWKYSVWLAMCNTNDNVGVQDSRYISRLQEEIGDRYDFSTGTLDDFAVELLKNDLSDLPVVRGELGDTWIHGVGSYPDAVSRFRRARTLFYKLEDYAEEKNVVIQAEKDEFYKQALIFTEHTFGANVLKFLGTKRAYYKKEFISERKERPEYQILEKSWEEQRNYVKNLEKIVFSLQEKLGYREDIEEVADDDLFVSINRSAIFVKTKELSFKLKYKYAICGANTINSFISKYLLRFYDWAVSDNSRLDYPEIDDYKSYSRPNKIEKEKDGYKITVISSLKSVQEFGNFAKIVIRIKKVKEGVTVEFSGLNKQPTPFVEYGDLIFDVGQKGNSVYAVEQCGQEINVDTDIVENANQILWSMDGYARIDNTYLYSLDAPLVSFGKSAICQFNGGKRRKKRSKFVINLFNTQWGTNFPQWIEEDCEYRFFIKNI